MNRRLAHEMAIAGEGRWSVTCVAPSRFHGDLRPIALEPLPGEADTLIPCEVRFDRSPHLMWYRGLRAVLARDWDLVHCWEEPYVLAAAQIASRVPRASRFVVATFQNLSKRYPWPLNAFERRTMRRADGWIAFGESAAAAMRGRHGYGGKPTRVIPPGVDVTRFAPDAAAGADVRARIGWPPGALVVGFVGRFVAAKGLPMLMGALSASEAPWHALFVGGGPLEPSLRAFAAAHPGRVHIATGARHDDIPSWMNAMTILCAPSQTMSGWREQFGRMLIEAMACGVPVVASDSGEIPHVLGDAGIVLPEQDRDAWRRTIGELLGDPSERARRATAGRAMADARFAWRRVAAEHIAFFDALVEQGRA